ncbi:ABC transporter substrate-binding protein [uncultured Aquitalea sp.]|uniref:substrate-binding periplasmic protein n=1 Tax=uncultured Aquitalea sp. TaxID=540272 RepID=UPI0025FB899B|nr:ABC transporter substrate-binding protein [uncultured Aquitalea sp.]
MRSFLLSLLIALAPLSAVAAEPSLRAGVVVDSPGPYSYTPDSPMASVYRDALEQISRLSGIRFDIEYFPAQRTQQLFEVGRLDVEVGVNPGWRALSPVGGFYSQPLGELGYQLCLRPTVSHPIRTLADLRGQPVGVLQGQPVQVFAAEFKRHDVRAEVSQSEAEMLNKLRIGRLPAVVLEKRQLEHQAALPPDSRCEPGAVVSVQQVMLRLHPQHRQLLPAINKAIAQLTANGRLKAIFQKPR